MKSRTDSLLLECQQFVLDSVGAVTIAGNGFVSSLREAMSEALKYGVFKNEPNHLTNKFHLTRNVKLNIKSKGVSKGVLI